MEVQNDPRVTTDGNPNQNETFLFSPVNRTDNGSEFTCTHTGQDSISLIVLCKSAA